jgi:hypothetical protein
MYVNRVKSDAADGGNHLTQYYAIICRCDRCGRIYSFPEGQEDDPDLCGACELNQVLDGEEEEEEQ